jgi:polyferredoxin
MDQMGYDKGLIRYTTENALSGERPKILRPRVIVYAIVLIALIVAVGYGLASRTPLALDIIRDRNTLYRETNDGMVENVYILKLINMDDKDHRYEVAVSGIDGMTLGLDMEQIPVIAHEVLSISARVRADPYSLERTSSIITFTLQSVDDESLRVEAEARFLGPAVQTK